MPQRVKTCTPGPFRDPGHRLGLPPVRSRSGWILAATIIIGLGPATLLSAQARGSLQAPVRVVSAEPSLKALDSGRFLARSRSLTVLQSGLARIGSGAYPVEAAGRRRIIRIDFLRN